MLFTSPGATQKTRLNDFALLVKVFISALSLCRMSGVKRRFAGVSGQQLAIEDTEGGRPPKEPKLNLAAGPVIQVRDEISVAK